MPNLNRLTAAGQILRTRPHQKILILTIEEEEQVARQVLALTSQRTILGCALKPVRWMCSLIALCSVISFVGCGGRAGGPVTPHPPLPEGGTGNAPNADVAI